LLSVGLTGNVGCGKSTVAALFEELGAARLDADALVRELLASGGAAVDAVLEAFPEAAGEDGEIDRAALARVVFADVQRRRELEHLMHPLVVGESRRRLALLESKGCELALTEAALLFEAARSGSAGEGSLERFDAIVVVACDPEIQRARAVMRGVESGLDEEAAISDFEDRRAAQLPQAEKAAAADWVIDNSGSLAETRRQVGLVHRELMERGAA
jgi:dephospho-CoA kinase